MDVYNRTHAIATRILVIPCNDVLIWIYDHVYLETQTTLDLVGIIIASFSLEDFAHMSKFKDHEVCFTEAFLGKFLKKNPNPVSMVNIWWVRGQIFIDKSS